MGYPAYRGRQIFRWLYTERVLDPALMTDLPLTLRNDLGGRFIATPLKVVRDLRAFDGSLKLLLEAPDGSRVESVLIPEGRRMTACLSSQVGCAVGCRFCATGLMGFKRNLSAGEIIAQLFAIEAVAGERMTNVVMMGMGEPLLNRSALFKAVQLITDPDGIGLSRRHFTISTAGWLPGILALTKAVREGHYHEPSIAEIREGSSESPQPSSEDGGHTFPRVKLALSLNSTTDEERLELMPLAGRYPLRETLAAAAEYAYASGERVSVNYLLLSGKNDSDDDARRLAELISAQRKYRFGSDIVSPFKTNLMEYNDVGAEFLRSSEARVESFLQILHAADTVVTVRTSRGRDIAAACGQLATETAVEVL